jgi:hypothetical protein
MSTLFKEQVIAVIVYTKFLSSIVSHTTLALDQSSYLDGFPFDNSLFDEQRLDDIKMDRGLTQIVGDEDQEDFYENLAEPKDFWKQRDNEKSDRGDGEGDGEGEYSSSSDDSDDPDMSQDDSPISIVAQGITWPTSTITSPREKNFFNLDRFMSEKEQRNYFCKSLF